jgi:hypothetical protein
MDLKSISKARDIVTESLQMNCNGLGIYGNSDKQKSFWTRDFAFASEGMNDLETVRKHLELLVRHQKRTGHNAGQMPLRIEEKSHALGLLGIDHRYKIPIAKYNSSQPWASDTVDATALFIVAACNYTLNSGDDPWLIKNRESLDNAALWLLSKKGPLELIVEGITANWADMTLKDGSVAYTNVCAWKALDLLADFFPEYKAEADNLKKAINKHLWINDKGYYADWISRKGKRYEHFFSDANVMAVAWGLADVAQAVRIYDFIDKHELTKIPIATCYPGMDLKNRVFMKIVFPHYNSSNIFGWWGPKSVEGRLRIMEETANRHIKENMEHYIKRDTQTLSSLIIRHNSSFEVLSPAGNMINHIFYPAQMHMSWSAGQFLAMYRKVEIMITLPQTI